MRADEKECIFCKIIRGEVPATRVFENERVVVIRDIEPKAPQHVLVIPKEHVHSLAEAYDEHRDLLGDLLLVARDVAKQLGIGEAFQVRIYSGAKAGQTVFHVHIHIMGGWLEDQRH